MAKFDKDKPYGLCGGLTVAHYFQNGHYFDYAGNEVTEDGEPIAPAEKEVEVVEPEVLEETPVVHAEVVKELFADNEEVVEAPAETADDFEVPMRPRFTEKALKKLSWNELRALSRSEGGPADTKKSCIDFLLALGA